jgi:transposase
MELLARLPECRILHVDKGYDDNAIRRFVEAKGVMPNIPRKANGIWKTCLSPRLYRDRHAVEGIFCRSKDLRHIATRYSRSARNVLAAVDLLP